MKRVPSNDRRKSDCLFFLWEEVSTRRLVGMGGWWEGGGWFGLVWLVRGLHACVCVFLGFVGMFAGKVCAAGEEGGGQKHRGVKEWGLVR